MPKQQRRLQRFNRNPDRIRPFVLTQRDTEIFRLVARYRFVRSTHIFKLIDGNKVGISRRLQRLYHAGYLGRPRQQIDYYHRAGSAPMIYCLEPRGAKHLSSASDTPASHLAIPGKKRFPSRLFLEHALMVSDIVVSFESACKTAINYRFVSSDECFARMLHPEFLRNRRSMTVKGERISVIPDAIFGIEDAGASRPPRFTLYLLEADRGTMPVSRRSRKQSCISRKLSAYTAALKRGHLRLANHHRIRILVLTVSEERLRNMRLEAQQLQCGRSLFAFDTLARFSADSAPLSGHLLRPQGNSVAKGD